MCFRVNSFLFLREKKLLLKNSSQLCFNSLISHYQGSPALERLPTSTIYFHKPTSLYQLYNTIPHLPRLPTKLP